MSRKSSKPYVGMDAHIGWVGQAERDRGHRAGLASDERARLKALERENQELSRPREERQS